MCPLLTRTSAAYFPGSLLAFAGVCGKGIPVSTADIYGVWRRTAYNFSSQGPLVQKRHFSTTDIVPPLRGTTPFNHFFNRAYEVEELTKILNGKPKLSLISGPVSSGKTSLILHVLATLSKESKQKCPVLYIDLRRVAFRSASEFVPALEEALTSWWDSFQEKEYGIPITLPTKSDAVGIESSSLRLRRLLKDFDARLSTRSLWAGEPSPILFIDEANTMKLLLDEVEGRACLASLFRWFEAHTKQNQDFHIILGSSDSFFHRWLDTNYLAPGHFKTYIVGDLPKEEAKRFWDTQLVSFDKTPREKPLFEDAYSVCGGNMMFLDSYYHEYRPGMQPSWFSVARDEYARVSRLFYSSRDPNKATIAARQAEAKPIWTRDEFLDLMRRLVAAEPLGFLQYNDLIKEWGNELVDEFINYNILHLRSSKEFAKDLPEAPEKTSIVTPERAATLLAAKSLLAERPKSGPV